MTPDQIVEELNQKVAEQEAAKRPEREYWAARQAMAERPDYVANPKNGQRVEDYVRAAGLDSTNADHILQAMQALESRGLLQLDPSKIEVRPRTRITEDDLYAMPMDELEKLGGRR